MLEGFFTAHLPRSIAAPARVLWRLPAVLKEHDRLVSFGQQMDPTLLDGARLLPDRLALLDVLPKGSCVAEIGVASGTFSGEIIARTRPKVLHLVDPWDQFVDAYSLAAMRQIEVDRKSEIAAGTVRLHRGYSVDVLGEFPDDYFDWVYLDAAHDYDNVAQDLRALFAKVKHAGLICGHDYTQWSSPADRYGVVEAVNEFVNRTRSRLLYLTNQADRQDSFVVELNKQTAGQADGS